MNYFKEKIYLVNKIKCVAMFRKEIRLDNGTVIGTFGWRDQTGEILQR